jgi:hypothetical protein
MTLNELNDRILAACETSTPARTRNRGVLVAHWLRLVVRSDAGVTNYASSHTVYLRRQVLRRAGLIPVQSAAELAGIAEALGVAAEDRGAIVRLAWTFADLSRVGQLRFAKAGAYFADLVEEASRLLDEQPRKAA